MSARTDLQHLPHALSRSLSSVRAHHIRLHSVIASPSHTAPPSISVCSNTVCPCSPVLRPLKQQQRPSVVVATTSICQKDSSAIYLSVRRRHNSNPVYVRPSIRPYIGQHTALCIRRSVDTYHRASVNPFIYLSICGLGNNRLFARRFDYAELPPSLFHSSRYLFSLYIYIFLSLSLSKSLSVYKILLSLQKVQM